MLKYLLLFFLFLSACSRDSIVTTSQNSESYSGMYIFEAPHGFKIFSDSGATKSISSYHQSGTIIINGSYFGQLKSGSYFPAGLWIENGIQKQPIDTNDPNLSYIFGMSGSHIEIFPNHLFGKKNAFYDFAFQAGPLILSGGILQDFGNSWHAHQLHERTLLGVTNSGKVYFFIFSDPISLSEVASRLMKDSRFALDSLTLLNLDGGPSTAFFDGKNGFRAEKKLPIVIRINH